MIHKDFNCEFYFIRHGQSESNTEPHLLGGRTNDSNLTARGAEQARLLGERLAAEAVRFDRVYCSTYRRASNTARIMVEAMGTPPVSIVEVPALIEIAGSDEWSGKTVDEVFTPAFRAYRGAKGNHFMPPDGESMRQVQRRASNWLEDEIIYNPELISRPVSMTVAIVSHGGTTFGLMQHILGFDQRMTWRVLVDNCSISRFRFNREGWSLITINDSLHARKLQN